MTTGNSDKIRTVKMKRYIGYIDFTQKLRKAGRDYKLDLCGSTATVYVSNTKFVFMDLNNCKGKGFHISLMVKKDIEAFVEANPTYNYTMKPYAEQFFNVEAIKKHINEPMMSVDINNCYFNTAFAHGFISRNTFDKAMVKPEWKLGRNASIGALATKIYSSEYKNGKRNNSQNCISAKHLLYSEEKAAIRNHIISHVWGLFIELNALIPDEVFMFLTDCFFVPTSRVKLVKDFLASKGYQSKIAPCEWVGLNERKNVILWRDLKKIYTKGTDRKFEFSKCIPKKPASDFDRGYIMRGQDEKLWMVKVDAKGVHTWVDNFKYYNYNPQQTNLKVAARITPLMPQKRNKQLTPILEGVL